MNDLRKAAEMALEYLEYLNELDIAGLDHEVHTNALRQALAQPEQNKRVCNTCNGTGIVKGLHNWAGGGKRTESCWACHEVAQPDPRPEWMKGDPDINRALERASQILAQSEKKQTHNLVHEIDLVLSDPESDLSEGAKRALRYVGKQLQAQPEPDWTTDMPVPPFKYLDFAEYKGTGESVKIKHTLAPPSKPWVSLTDEEIHNIYDEIARRKPYNVECSRRNVGRAIEAALRSKNNG